MIPVIISWYKTVIIGLCCYFLLLLFIYVFYLIFSAYSEECHLGSRCVLDGHLGPVWDCTFSTNGKILASAWVKQILTRLSDMISDWNDLKSIAYNAWCNHCLNYSDTSADVSLYYSVVNHKRIVCYFNRAYCCNGWHISLTICFLVNTKYHITSSDNFEPKFLILTDDHFVPENIWMDFF